MSHPIERLLKLAHRLETAAITSEAKAKEHTAANEPDLAELEQHRAANAREYSADCVYWHGLLKAREKRSAFTPPTLAEAQGYAAAEPTLRDMPAREVEKWWLHFDGNGWKVGRGGTPMKSWKSALRTWFIGWQERSGRQDRPTGGSTMKSQEPRDPDGWREFLKAKAIAYVAHYRAAPWMKTEFRKPKK